ncbi:MAG: helix-turn-helix domain-containing protein [Verrucomicrobiota bacterium]
MKNPESESRVTLRDLGKALRVSHVTISLALRNSPNIPPSRCKQVQEMAKRMGYRPNQAASALANYKRTSRITPVHAELAWLNLWKHPKQLHSYV